MEQITQQLQWVRRTGRNLLVAQRLCQWGAAMSLAVLVLVTADYLLRFPGAMRLVIGLIVVGLAVGWLVGRLRRAAGFGPTLGELALRAERLYPALAGTLTSAVYFTVDRGAYDEPASTATMARHAIDEAQQRVGKLSLRRLIDPTRTVRLASLALVCLLVLAGIAAASPGHAATAARRWLMPLGDAEWPKRVEVVNTTGATVWPIDAALPLGAKVVRGDYQGLRVWAHYRLRHGNEAGPWQRGIMSPAQSPGDYELLIELSQLASPGADNAVIEFYLAAGDDRTPTAGILLTPRPAVVGSSVSIQPPAYAEGLIDPLEVDLHGQSGPVATAAALAGSRVVWTLRFNKPLPVGDVHGVLPGLALPHEVAAPVEGDEGDQLVVVFALTETVATPLELVDRHGLRAMSTRRYRIEAMADRLPRVALTEPGADEAVLATAVVGVEAAAQDDVAVAELSLEAQVHERARTLDRAAGRRADMTLDHRLDLQTLGVQPGDNVTLAAVARDIYFEDADRPAVRSTERRLRIIDSAQLVQQLRGDLGAVRQQAIRMERTQRRLIDAPDPPAASEQAQLTGRLGVQRSLVERLTERAARNRLDEPALDELLSEADRLLAEAETRSAAAERAFDQDPDAARQEQEAARAAMEQLVDLLDQGQDALTLQLALRALATQQDQLAQETRQLLPQTAGRELDELSPPLREQVERLGQRQEQLQAAARQLVRDMQSSAQALRQQSQSDRDRAAAEALAEAAAIAQRQGLEQDMQQAAEQVGQNQLSQAGQQQSNAQRTLAQMSEAVGSQQQRQAEMLRRRLIELAQLLEQLIERQQSQLDQLGAAEDDDALLRLAPPLAQLRRATLGAEEVAAQSQQTADAGESIGRAINEQGRGVVALRDRVKTEALDAEQTARDQLAAALEAVRRAQREQQTEQAREDRERLRREYERLAEQQQQLHDRVAPLLDEPQLDRRQRADLRAAERSQATIREDADVLWSQVGDTLIFNRLHERIEQASQRVERQLAGGSTDRAIGADQSQIAVSLRLMAQALEQQTQAEQFDRPAGSAGGGGQGGAPGSDQAVPPLAELRLLRNLQARVYDTTRELDGEQADRDALMQLADEQGELAELGERLIEKAQAQQGPRP